MAKTLTELDRKLLALLRRNGRESFVNLAEELDTSEATVRSRVKRLSETGVIRQFTVRTTGANLKALIDVVSDTDVHTSTVAETIAAWGGVEVVYETSGSEDLMVVVEADDTDELNATVEDIRKLAHVRSTRTRLILKEVY
jgi:DNA-binding Lrp family transcriptional regulator